MHFLDEVLFQNLVHINDLHLLRDTHVALGIMSSCVTHRPFYFTRIILPSFSFVFFGKFQQQIYVCMWGHYGSKVMGVHSGPFSEM